MVKVSRHEALLIALVERMAPPSVLVSCPDLRILAANQPMLAKYGAPFAESGAVVIHGCEPPKLNSELYLSFKDQSAPGEFEAADSAVASFKMVRTSETVAFIFELPPKVKVCQDCGRVEPLRTQPFHCIYMESAATGKRAFPHPAALRKAGLMQPDQSEVDWRSLIDKSDLLAFDNAIENARTHGGSHELSYSVKTIDGGRIPVSDFFSLMPSHDGKWPTIVGTVMNRQPVDEDLKSLKHLELQGRLLGGMVHDFKNLLGGIQNIIEWSMSMAQDKPELVKAMSKTLAYTAQATKLISGTLRMGSTKKEVQTELIKLPAIVLEIEELIRHSVPSTISLRFEMDSGVPAIYAQRDTLKDIVLNLCVNARDAMAKRGKTLRIAVERKELKSENGTLQAFAVLRVQDDGCGMTPAQINNLFEAFQSTKEHGVGLGLWMVNKNVKSLDGRISVSSEPGKGSCFEILFPAAKEQRFEPQEPEKKSDALQPDALRVDLRDFIANGSKKTLLYVEDDPLIRSSVAAWLDSIGFQILEADNGTDALRIFKENVERIDLVIQDFIIPGLRGDELLDGILKVNPSVPVIVASANPDDEQVAALRQRGARAFLPKPFLMDDLLAILNKIFQPSKV